MQYFRADVKKKQKPDGSLVTAGDLAINDELHDMLTTARPDYGWLSEEGPDDPARLPNSAAGSSIRSTARAALLIARGMVHRPVPQRQADDLRRDPATKRLLYLAEAGKGATCNGAPLHMSDTANLNRARWRTLTGACQAGRLGRRAAQMSFHAADHAPRHAGGQ